MAISNRQALFKRIPGVDRLLESPKVKDREQRYPRSLILLAINQALEDLRSAIRKGTVEKESDLDMDHVADLVVSRLRVLSRPSLRPVINATGVVVHTNLGRSPLAEKALKKFRPVAGGYSNLEYDLHEGKRGSRHDHVEEILKELTSAEAAMVVNNNAAAVFVSLETLARGREVIVSRGQLVEIGGSFRIPDVMRKSGAKMVEVGTTNKTHLADYETAINPDTALLLKVHTSNFQVIGFTEEVPMSDLAALARKYNIPVMEDLGSGCLIDFSEYGLKKEPTAQESLALGASLVTFSGDKLLGGPQAGIILGREDLVASIKKNQLSRALRIDKLTLLALEETLRIYRDKEAAVREIPTLKMICQPERSLAKKADRLLKLIGRIKTDHFSIGLTEGHSMVGGGALPLLELPTRLLYLAPKKTSARSLEVWLRSYDPPVITRVEKERVFFDVRTIQERELKIVAEAVNSLASVDKFP
ncbi:MAG: L-seryl-tRNA(Sec) selenium transferase [Thermodesulfobacteriota bacterium]|nr:L-seryl-tRNA(Sec) selenium transferase [Thermodesulfobacteriota bacterium]